MKVFIYSEARQNLAKLLVIAQKAEVEIRRRDGTTFSLISKKKAPSPFDIPGINSLISSLLYGHTVQLPRISIGLYFYIVVQPALYRTCSQTRVEKAGVGHVVG